MELQFELFENDYVDFNMHYMSISPTIKRSIFIQRYIISIIYLIAPFVSAKITDIPLWYWSIGFILLYIIWVIFYPKYFRKRAIKQVVKLLKEGKNVGIIGKYTLSLTPDCIIGINDSGESKTNWGSVENIYDTENHIFIYVGSMKAYIVPLRAFKTKDEKVFFINKLNEYRENA